MAATDLHRSQWLYSELADAVNHHCPDVLVLVGDFLDCSGMPHPQLSSEECAIAIARFNVPEVVFARGNHEDYNWQDFEEVWLGVGAAL
jgi:hypothetical protein